MPVAWRLGGGCFSFDVALDSGTQIFLDACPENRRFPARAPFLIPLCR
jgi:hypothetical protein